MTHASRFFSFLVSPTLLVASLTSGCPAPGCPGGLALDSEGRCSAQIVADAGTLRDGSAAGDGATREDGAVGDGASALPDAAAADACVSAVFHSDLDGDGHGDPAAMMTACVAPAGYVASADDCNDTCATCFPMGVEVCDGLDQDCDGTVDDGVLTTFYVDGDGDGHGAGSALTGCAVPPGHALDALDCNDLVASVHPGAIESCDGVDQDCDMRTDEGVTSDYVPDCDGDGFVAADAVATAACAFPAGVPPVCGASDGTPRWLLASTSAGIDCFDASRNAFPGARPYYDTSYSYRGVASFDYDCDGAATARITATGTASASCAWRTVPGAPRMCVVTGERWNTTAVPACGATAQLQTCEGLTCTAASIPTRAACR